MYGLQQNNEGFYFRSPDTGIVYEILEGMTTNHKFTSDILFIMLMDADYNVENNVVGWLFGASDLIEGHEAEYEESIAEMVKSFEKENGFI